MSADPSRYARRAVTIPAMMLGFVFALALAPLALPACVLVDLARRRPTMPTTRLAGFFVSYLFTESIGLVQLFALWLACLGSKERLARRAWTVQRRYVGMHMWFVERLFSLRFHVEGDELVRPGPLLVFVRHSSIVDTIIPGVFIANRHLIELKYVLKKELLVDPCLDIAGNWLPNHFVARDGSDTDGEIAKVRALKHGLAENQGVLLYPEGTRFSSGKRTRSLERLKADPLAHERASRLVHLLLPRPGGALALLDAAPACDVLFVGHSGLEGFSSFKEIWSGRLTGRTIHIRFWRERADSIPAGRDEQLAWLQRCWERMDAWLSTTEPESPAPPLRAAG
ncbi:MAG: lysophospholipid acyltransferase family protein [Myxococcaceae bacterium]|jgi:1-acyl-sn-glycerol-3-phosphate acyltransferase|nr:lysophospholipid acyltransferase family protein [Myxococcaceae bacterium]